MAGKKKDDAHEPDPRVAKLERLRVMSPDQICDALKRATQRVDYQVDGEVLQGFLAMVELVGPPVGDFTPAALERAGKADAEAETALERARKAERELAAANARITTLERELEDATAPTGQTPKPAK